MSRTSNPERDATDYIKIQTQPLVAVINRLHGFEEDDIPHVYPNGHAQLDRTVAVDALVTRPVAGAEIETHTANNTELLLVLRRPDQHQGNKWALPGGFLDRDETIPEGVIRECAEETGRLLGNVSLFTILDHPHRASDYAGNVSHVHTAEVIGRVPVAHPEDPDVAQTRWHRLDELPDNFAFDHGLVVAFFINHLQNPMPLEERIYMYQHPLTQARLAS